MTITKAVAEKLCTKAEFNFVEASFPQGIKELTVAKIKRKIEATKKHLNKWKTLQKKQERDLSKEIKAGKKTPLNPIERTKKKVQILTETIERFKAQAAKLDAKEKKEKEAAKKAALKKAKTAKAKMTTASKNLGKTSKSKLEVPMKKQMKGRNKTISSQQRSANKRFQAKRDKR